MIHPLRKIHSRIMRVLVMLLIGIIILLAVIAGAAPFAAGYALREALYLAGNDHVFYEDIDLNVFTGTFGVYGLYVGNGPHRVLEAEKTWINIRMLDLLRGDLRSQSVEFQGAYVRVDDIDGLRVAGIRAGGARDAQPEPTGDEPPLPAIPVFGTDRLLLTDSRVAIHFGDASPLNVEFDEVTVEGFVFDADASPAPLHLVARVGQGRLELSGQLSADATRQRLETALKVDNLPLERITRLGGPELKRLGGVLDLDYQLTVTHSLDEGSALDANGSLVVADGRFGLEDGVIDAQRIEWTGQQALRQRDGSISINANARLDLTGPRFERAAMAGSAATLHWDGKLEGRLEPGGLRLDQDGRLQLAGFRVQDGGAAKVELSGEDLNWTGTFNGRLVEEGLRGQQSGQLTLKALTAVLASGTLTVDGLEGRSEAELADDLSVTGGVQMAGLAYDDAASERRMLSMDALRIEDIEVDGANRRLALGSVTLETVDALVNKLPDGQWRGVRPLLAALGLTGDEAGGEAASPWQLRVGGITFAGASQMKFQDDSVKPPVTVVMRELEGSVGTIDTSQPAARTSVTMRAKVDEYGSVSLKGDVVPLAERPTARLNSNIQQVDVARFSPYVANITGYAIRSGQLNAGISMNLDQGALKGEVKLHLRSPDFQPVDPEQVDEFTQTAAMPLELVMATLGDKHGDLRLDVPISGDVTDPKFSAEDAFRIAAGKAMQAAAMSYLKQTLQPYGSLITIFSLAGKAAGYVALEPVMFEPGTSALSPAATNYLDKVAGLMRERGSLRIKLCGVAVPADRAPLKLPVEGELAPEAQEVLSALARDRALVIKDYLAGKDGVKVNHLFICTPEVSTAPDAAPRVMLEL